MPELPEVETVRRTMEAALLDQTLVDVELPEDPILLSKRPAQPFIETLLGAKVCGVGRKGKYWWLQLEKSPWLFGHLGMSGWIRELGEPTIRLREHGEAPLDDEAGRPRFLKMLLTASNGRRVAFSDGRRLGRLWLSEDADRDAKIQKLGPDCLHELPSAKEFHALVSARKAPIKGVLMNQEILSGIGNWIADEVLYHSCIAPARGANTLTEKESQRLRETIAQVVEEAVRVGADSSKFPEEWLFHHRWGGSKGADTIGSEQIVRETVAGRTTAWVPTRQK